MLSQVSSLSNRCAECNIENRAVSGGALTDTTILNRTGLTLALWKGIDYNLKSPQGSYGFTCTGVNRI